MMEVDVYHHLVSLSGNLTGVHRLATPFPQSNPQFYATSFMSPLTVMMHWQIRIAPMKQTSYNGIFSRTDGVVDENRHVFAHK